MTAYDYDIGIIGGGAAGLTVASGAAQLGAKTLLIEKEKELGGDCLHYGCVPSKTLIKSAHVYHLMKSAERFGLPALQLQPVDFKKVADRIRSVIGRIQLHDSVDRFCKLGAVVKFGEPFFTDEHTIDLPHRPWRWPDSHRNGPGIQPSGLQGHRPAAQYPDPQQRRQGYGRYGYAVPER
jgi:pyruvate/2-oxoglutarate dehydrogenase complex dihydrolipoamide dehydrogenase (E3) component